MKQLHLAVAAIAGIAASAAIAQTPIPGPINTTGKVDVRPGAPIAGPCKVDPAILSITVLKGKDPGSAQVSVKMGNLGTSAWNSGPEQQYLRVAVKNGNTGATSAHSFRLPARAAARGSMGYYSTPMIAGAFDTFEFSGSVEASISYDPDIAIDANRCNDDMNAANNRKTVSNRQVQDLLGSTARSRIF